MKRCMTVSMIKVIIKRTKVRGCQIYTRGKTKPLLKKRTG